MARCRKTQQQKTGEMRKRRYDQEGGAKLTEPGRPARTGAGAAGTGRAVEGASRAGTEIERQIRACPASFCRN